MSKKSRIKVIYVASPLRGDIENNLLRAKKYSRKVTKIGFIPITPHLYFSTFLDDRKNKEREVGMKMGIELLSLCDELWAFGKPSIGMEAEIKVAIKMKIPVRFFKK